MQRARLKRFPRLQQILQFFGAAFLGEVGIIALCGQVGNALKIAFILDCFYHIRLLSVGISGGSFGDGNGIDDDISELFGVGTII